MKILNTLFYVVSGVAIITLPFLIVNWAKYIKVSAANRSRLVHLPAMVPVKSMILFVGSILIAITIAGIMSSCSRVEALNALRNLSGNYKVNVNSEPAHDPDKIVAALKEVAPQLAHHSHPTKIIRVDVQSEKGSLTLELGRDSGYAQEYWVFYPKYRVTSNNEIGRVTTSVFDEY